jgi:hypothetical protein
MSLSRAIGALGGAVMATHFGKTIELSSQIIGAMGIQAQSSRW